MSAKEIPKQNHLEKFEIREQSKNKTEAKWKYKVSATNPAAPAAAAAAATGFNWFCWFWFPTEQQTGLSAEDGGGEQSGPDAAVQQ